MKPLCTRTLRKQVLEYIRFTNRVAITQEFLPSDEEHQLYQDVSAYLQRDVLLALPSSQRMLMTMIGCFRTKVPNPSQRASLSYGTAEGSAEKQTPDFRPGFTGYFWEREHRRNLGLGNQFRRRMLLLATAPCCFAPVLLASKSGHLSHAT